MAPFWRVDHIVGNINNMRPAVFEAAGGTTHVVRIAWYARPDLLLPSDLPDAMTSRWFERRKLTGVANVETIARSKPAGSNRVTSARAPPLHAIFRIVFIGRLAGLALPPPASGRRWQRCDQIPLSIAQIP